MYVIRGSLGLGCGHANAAIGHYKTCSVLDSYMRSMNHGNREGTAGSDSSASEGDDEEEKVLEDPEIPKKSAMLPGAVSRPGL